MKDENQNRLDEGFKDVRAVEFYCGYLTADNYKEYFPNVIVSTMKGTLNSLEDRMAKLLFKFSVE